MNILGLVCSPRSNGNTEMLVREVLSSAAERGAETRLIQVGRKNIAPCDDCQSCRRVHIGKCRVDDDMQEIYEAMFAADGIVFGTPVYFWSVSAQTKAMIDRTYALLDNRPLRDKVGGIVVVARRAGDTSAFGLLANYINHQRMHLAGGVTAYGLAKGDVLKDADGITQAKILGKAMVKLIGKLAGNPS